MILIAVPGSRVVIAVADSIAQFALCTFTICTDHVMFHDFSLRGSYVPVLLLQQLIVIVHLVTA